jgi:hypothetical protein
MGSNGASSGSGGGVGPAGIKTDGTYGTKKDAKKASSRNELRTAIKNFKSPLMGVVKTVGEKLEDAARPYNTRRRKEFISKYNTSVPPGERIDMTDEQIGSKEGLASLRNVGYRTAADTSLDRDGPDRNQTTQIPKTILSPTSAEVSQSEAANAVNEEDPLYLRKKKIKARGRSQTILTSSKGVETDEGLTLGKKSLLGS